MANVKQVHIEARVPFDWMSAIGEKDAAFMAAWLMGPSCGLRYWYGEQSMWANTGGGKTTCYVLHIAGHEAIAWPAFERMVAILTSIGVATEKTLRRCEQRTSYPMGPYRCDCIDIEDVA